MNRWVILRSCITALFITAIVIVTVADYPYDWPIWYWMTMDPNGYLHEMFYIFVGWTAAIWWTVYWERKMG